LLDAADWVPAKVICARFCIDERGLRASGDQPGLLDDFAVSGNKGYKHVRNLTSVEVEAVEHRLRSHAVAQLVKLRRWKSARKNNFTGLKPRFERHTGQGVML
jgi:hypothetical protein